VSEVWSGRSIRLKITAEATPGFFSPPVVSFAERSEKDYTGRDFGRALESRGALFLYLPFDLSP
jgi:hypothetical protein